jgi:hypothetical protein
MIVLPKTESDLVHEGCCEFGEDFRAELEVAVYVVEHTLWIVVIESV